MEVRNYNKLSVSDILSRSLSLLKDNVVEILKVIGIFIVPTIVITIGIIFGVIITSFLKIAFMSSYLDAYDIFERIGLGTFSLIFIIGIIVGLVVSYATAIITKIIDDANKGNQVSWRSANSYVWERKWRVIGLNVLVWVMFLFFIVIFSILGILLSALTFGIGLIIFIPAIIAISFISSAVWTAFNSMLIVNDLVITDAIRETFILFRKGHFWSTIGYLSAISGINIGIALLLFILSIIPFIGNIIMIIGQVVMQYYLIAYVTIYVLDRTKHISPYNNYETVNSNYNGINNSYEGINSNYSSVNNDYNGLNDNHDNLLSNEDSNNKVEEVDSTTTENNDKVTDNNNKNDGFIDPIN